MAAAPGHGRRVAAGPGGQFDAGGAQRAQALFQRRVLFDQRLAEAFEGRLVPSPGAHECY